MKKMPKISVVVPVYNVENYIERCVRTLFEQTMNDDVEYVFVNDGSTDNSINILSKLIEEYSSLKKQIQIIHHPCNMSLGSARKTGILAAHGDYIFNYDSGDWIDKDFLKIMYSKAIATNADVVWCDYYMGKKDGNYALRNTYCNQNKKDTLNAIIGYTCKQGLYVWNKLIRRSLFCNEKFVFSDNINLTEDHVMTFQCFLYANITAHVDKALYYYYFRNEALSKLDDYDMLPQQCKDVINVNDIIFDIIATANIYDADCKNAVNVRKLYTKRLILSRCHTTKCQWYNLYPELKIDFFKKPFQIRTKLGLWGVQHKMPWMFDVYLWSQKIKEKYSIRRLLIR